MDERQEKSILEMGRGAIMERADYEMRAMIRNILDPNTSAKAARKLNITLTFKPGDDRQTIVVECVAKSMAIERHKKEGNLTPDELNSLRAALRDTRATAHLLSGYPDAWG